MLNRQLGLSQGKNYLSSLFLRWRELHLIFKDHVFLRWRELHLIFKDHVKKSC